MIEIVAPDDRRTLGEFARLAERIYWRRGLPAALSPAETAAMLDARSPFSAGRRFHPLMARRGATAAARVVAVIDERYCTHWGERLGHLVLFEAAPRGEEAALALLERAGEWLEQQGAVAARAGYGPFEPGFVIDRYRHVLRRLRRHARPHYHALFKDAGFDTEIGAAEYVIPVSADLVARYARFLSDAQSARCTIVPLRVIDDEERVAVFTKTWNAAYAGHWGLAPLCEAEMALMFRHFAATPTLDLSAIAYRDGEPIGVVLVQDERSPWPAPLRRLFGHQVCSFAVGVVPSARGMGLALALAAHAYRQLIARGERMLGYGLVVDGNWPSRRIAQKLGAHVCANLVTYRKILGRRAAPSA